MNSIKSAFCPVLERTIQEIEMLQIATAVLGLLALFLISYVFHCTWVTSEAYSSPSIVLAARSGGGRVIFDDFREAYYWLSQNTPEVHIFKCIAFLVN